MILLPFIVLYRGVSRSCLELANKHRLENLAFPAISTGVYGYPVEEAAEVLDLYCRAFLIDNQPSSRGPLAKHTAASWCFYLQPVLLLQQHLASVWLDMTC